MFNISQFASIITKRLLEFPTRDIPTSEFANILQEYLAIVFNTDDDWNRFERLKYWLKRSENDSDAIVCANVEMVRFGAITAQRDRSKKSSDKCPTTLSDPKDLNKMLSRANVNDIKVVARYADTVESFAKEIDQWVMKTRFEGEQKTLPTENITPDAKRSGNAKMSDMKYISVSSLLRCIAHGQNTTTLNEFCVNYAAAMQVYLSISNRLKTELLEKQARILRETSDRTRITNALKNEWLSKKDCKIDDLQRKVDKITQQNEEMKQLHQQSIEMLRRQGIVLDDIKIQNDGLKDQNTELITKVDKLGEKFDSMANILSKVAVSSNVIADIMKRTHSEDIMKIDARSPSKGIQTLKMLVLFGCYDQSKTHLILRFACCNFETITKVLKEAIKFTNGPDSEKKFMYLTTSAIALSGDIEVNLENGIINKTFTKFEGKKIVDPNGKERANLQKWRSFKIDGTEDAKNKFYHILYELRSAFSMHHQTSLINYMNDEETPDILKQKAASIYRYCDAFAKDATKYCQQYIDAIIEEKDNKTAELVQVSKLSKEHTDARVLNKQSKMIQMHIAEYSKTLLKLRIQQFNLDEYIQSLNIDKQEESHQSFDTSDIPVRKPFESDEKSITDETVVDFGDN